MTYKDILIVIFLLLPFLLVGYKNSFSNGIVTFIRFFVSVFALWGYLILSWATVDFIETRFGCCYDAYGQGDSSRVFAVVLGWLPAFVLSLLAYAMIKVFLWLLKTMRARQGRQLAD